MNNAAGASHGRQLKPPYHKDHLDGGKGKCPAVYFGALGASSGQMTAGKVHFAIFKMSGKQSVLPRFPIVIRENNSDISRNASLLLALSLGGS